MPKGVEHKFCTKLCATLGSVESLMPKGVEHGFSKTEINSGNYVSNL